MQKKILLVGANPKEIDPLRLDKEARAIKESLQLAKKRDEFQIETCLAARALDLSRALINHEPQFVHFSGHGSNEGIAFEDESGNVHIVEKAILSNLFRQFSDKIECVLLNSCYSAEQAEAISNYVPYVIGMKYALDDETATSFSVGFYDALGAGWDVKRAFEMACVTRTFAPALDNCAPVLLERGKAPSQPNKHEKTAPKIEGAAKVFISYSHDDEEMREKLVKHLSLLRRQGVIDPWHDRALVPGGEWDSEIDARLNEAHIILLLVSSSFLASDYCYDKEMASAMNRHESGDARVIPIILRPCDWKTAPFAKLMALPREAKPVTKWDDQHEAFASIAQEIRSVVNIMKA